MEGIGKVLREIIIHCRAEAASWCLSRAGGADVGPARGVSLGRGQTGEAGP